jgi:putative LysE/RhtB family amino acid efflux pump
MSTLALGFGLGALVAAQLGPMSLFLIRSTLRSGPLVGLAIGAGIAVIDAAYAALGAAGAAPLLTIDALRLTLGLIGAAVLVALGARTLWSAFRVRTGGEVPDDVAGPRRAFLTSLGATASNPLTIASWAAVFAAASTAGAADSGSAALLLLTGVGLGSLFSTSALALFVAATRRYAGPKVIRTVDAAAGVGLIGFGGLLAHRSLSD